MTTLLDKPNLAGQPPRPAGIQTSVVAKKVVLSRSQQLLELACKVAGASQGGIGLLSAEGDLVEHIAGGVPEAAAVRMWHTPRLTDLLRFVLARPEPTCVADLAGCHPHLGAPADLPPVGPFVGLPLRGLGRVGVAQGALYLARTPGQPAFTARDLETVEPIRTFLEQGNLFEESHLLAQLRLLNRVAQAAAGSLDLALILQKAIQELERHLPLHVCLVWLRDDGAGDGLSLAAAGSVPHVRTGALGLTPGLRLTVEQTPFADCLHDGQGLYLDFGGRDPAAPRPRPGADQEPPDPAASVLAAELAARGATYSFAAPLRAGDQTVGVLQSVCTRPTGFTSEQIQLVYLVADLLGPAVSNCRLFARLRSTYEELRATQNQLIHSEKMRALGELASGMAHDFNNSLCGVIGFLELSLMDRDLGGPSRGYLDSARTCALDAAQTVRRVQDFARWRQHEAVFQVLDVNELLRQTVELTRPKWEKNPGRVASGHGRITVELRPRAAAPVSGSAAELREVLTNLVFNAVDAMEQGGTLTLQSWSTGADVFVAVRDTGVGMPAAVRQRIFEPFFTTKGERGSGMGLSVAFGIIQRHGGEISVVSEPGQGTTFTVRLPAGREGAAPEPGAAAAGPAPGPAEAGKGLRILAVEDEPSIREYLTTVLRQLGHEPSVAADAEEGLAKFSGGAYDVVFTDLGLPGMSGEELARAITRQSPETPVVLLTGWADQLHMEARVLPGVSRILGKPLTVASLVETLDAVRPRS